MLEKVVLRVATPDALTVAVPKTVLPRLKVTLPVGALPVTVAVKMTVCPSPAGLGLAVNAVVLVPACTSNAPPLSNNSSATPICRILALCDVMVRSARLFGRKLSADQWLACFVPHAARQPLTGHWGELAKEELKSNRIQIGLEQAGT